MKSTIHVVSLGPGDPDLLNEKTLHLLRGAESLILRTARHPLSSWLSENGITFTSLDSLYDQFDSFDALNRAAAEILIRAAASSPVVYAVPDAQTDRTVRVLLERAGKDITVFIVPGVSLYDAFLSTALDCLPDRPLIIVSARELTQGFSFDPGLSLLVTELDNEIQAGEVKLFLAEVLDDEQPVFLLRLDTPPVRIPLFELDRRRDLDHRCAVLIPASFSRDGKSAENHWNP